MTIAGISIAGLLAATGIWRLGTMSAGCLGTRPATRDDTVVSSSSRFAVDYATARARFLRAAAVAGGRVTSVPHPHSGPAGEPLYMDAALFGPGDAGGTLLVASGTHGVEGFAGSGIQTMLLEEGVVARLPDGVSLLLIHAINPYGMAHLRRVNEDNVDVNRNFRDHATPAPPNPQYDRLAGAIAPPSLSFWREAGSWMRLLWHRLTAGSRAAQAAVSGGQYSHPAGLFYGGTVETWSNTQLRAILQRYLSDAVEVVVIDIHTGLGDFGGAELILHVPAESPEYQRAVATWGAQSVRTSAAGQSVSAHVDASWKAALPRILPAAEVTGVTLELGTVSPMSVFKALRAENWLHHHGGSAHSRAPHIKACLLQAFHPDSPEWEASVRAHGRAVVQGALHRLGE